ncbi:MAG: GIY-YIG nuclease family protein [Candidatus Nealsonbacteria bacterium]|nr:GIY-YIG nuclease family protein [Candidatus Nealsonbacteria bacterium]
MYFVYVIKSKKDGKYYTGITDNLDRRINQHNRGSKATPSTKNRGPFYLVYYEKVENRKTARRREKHLKSGTGREFIKNII